MEEIETFVRKVCTEGDLSILTKKQIRTQYQSVYGKATVTKEEKEKINEVLNLVVQELADKAKGPSAAMPQNVAEAIANSTSSPLHQGKKTAGMEDISLPSSVTLPALGPPKLARTELGPTVLDHNHLRRIQISLSKVNAKSTHKMTPEKAQSLQSADSVTPEKSLSVGLCANNAVGTHPSSESDASTPSRNSCFSAGQLSGAHGARAATVTVTRPRSLDRAHSDGGARHSLPAVIQSRGCPMTASASPRKPFNWEGDDRVVSTSSDIVAASEGSRGSQRPRLRLARRVSLAKVVSAVMESGDSDNTTAVQADSSSEEESGSGCDRNLNCSGSAWSQRSTSPLPARRTAESFRCSQLSRKPYSSVSQVCTSSGQFAAYFHLKNKFGMNSELWDVEWNSARPLMSEERDLESEDSLDKRLVIDVSSDSEAGEGVQLEPEAEESDAIPLEEKEEDEEEENIYIRLQRRLGLVENTNQHNMSSEEKTVVEDSQSDLQENEETSLAESETGSQNAQSMGSTSGAFSSSSVATEKPISSFSKSNSGSLFVESKSIPGMIEVSEVAAKNVYTELKKRFSLPREPHRFKDSLSGEKSYSSCDVLHMTSSDSHARGKSAPIAKRERSIDAAHRTEIGFLSSAANLVNRTNYNQDLYQQSVSSFSESDSISKSDSLNSVMKVGNRTSYKQDLPRQSVTSFTESDSVSKSDSLNSVMKARNRTNYKQDLPRQSVTSFTESDSVSKSDSLNSVMKAGNRTNYKQDLPRQSVSSFLESDSVSRSDQTHNLAWAKSSVVYTRLKQSIPSGESYVHRQTLPEKTNHYSSSLSSHTSADSNVSGKTHIDHYKCKESVLRKTVGGRGPLSVNSSGKKLTEYGHLQEVPPTPSKGKQTFLAESDSDVLSSSYSRNTLQSDISSQSERNQQSDGTALSGSPSESSGRLTSEEKDCDIYARLKKRFSRAGQSHNSKESIKRRIYDSLDFQPPISPCPSSAYYSSSTSRLKSAAKGGNIYARLKKRFNLSSYLYMCKDSLSRRSVESAQGQSMASAQGQSKASDSDATHKSCQHPSKGSMSRKIFQNRGSLSWALSGRRNMMGGSPNREVLANRAQSGRESESSAVSPPCSAGSFSLDSNRNVVPPKHASQARFANSQYSRKGAKLTTSKSKVHVNKTKACLLYQANSDASSHFRSRGVYTRDSKTHDRKHIIKLKKRLSLSGCRRSNVYKESLYKRNNSTSSSSLSSDLCKGTLVRKKLKDRVWQDVSNSDGMQGASPYPLPEHKVYSDRDCEQRSVVSDQRVKTGECAVRGNVDYAKEERLKLLCQPKKGNKDRRSFSQMDQQKHFEETVQKYGRKVKDRYVSATMKEKHISGMRDEKVRIKGVKNVRQSLNNSENKRNAKDFAIVGHNPKDVKSVTKTHSSLSDRSFSVASKSSDELVKSKYRKQKNRHFIHAKSVKSDQFSVQFKCRKTKRKRLTKQSKRTSQEKDSGERKRSYKSSRDALGHHGNKSSKIFKKKTSDLSQWIFQEDEDNVEWEIMTGGSTSSSDEFSSDHQSAVCLSRNDGGNGLPSTSSTVLTEGNLDIDKSLSECGEEHFKAIPYIGQKLKLPVIVLEDIQKITTLSNKEGKLCKEDERLFQLFRLKKERQKMLKDRESEMYDDIWDTGAKSVFMHAPPLKSIQRVRRRLRAEKAADCWNSSRQQTLSLDEFRAILKQHRAVKRLLLKLKTLSPSKCNSKHAEERAMSAEEDSERSTQGLPMGWEDSQSFKTKKRKKASSVISDSSDEEDSLPLKRRSVLMQMNGRDSSDSDAEYSGYDYTMPRKKKLKKEKSEDVSDEDEGSLSTDQTDEQSPLKLKGKKRKAKERLESSSEDDKPLKSMSASPAFKSLKKEEDNCHSDEETSLTEGETKRVSGSLSDNSSSENVQLCRNDESDLDTSSLSSEDENTSRQSFKLSGQKPKVTSKKKQPASKIAKRAEERSNTKEKSSEDSRYVKHLKLICRKVGIFVRSNIHFAGCWTEKQKIDRLKQALSDAGMKGQPSLSKVDEVNLKKEMAALDSTNIIHTKGRPKRQSKDLFVNTHSPKKSLSPIKRQFSRIKDLISESESDSE